MVDPASITGPFMYPFATGATGRYFPWLRESRGRPDTGAMSPGKGRQRRYLVYQDGLFPTNHTSGICRDRYPARSQPSTNACMESILCNEIRSTSPGPVWHIGSCSVAMSSVRVPSLGQRRRTDSGLCAWGRVRGTVLPGVSRRGTVQVALLSSVYGSIDGYWIVCPSRYPSSL
jgi:hypothetical protein